MTAKIISYKLEPVNGGFISRCLTNEAATSFGKTETEAGDNLITSIREYLKEFPDREDKIFNTPTIEMN